MIITHLPKRRLLPSLLLAIAILLGLGVAWSFVGHKGGSMLADAATVGSAAAASPLSPPLQQLGPSGLPLPRFVSLKTEKVNVRKGPSSDHAVAWVYQSRGLPVEITAEFETWRRVRDSEGAEGWILQNMLTGKRRALIAPSRKGSFINLMAGASVESGPIAKLASGVMGDIKSCDGTWCHITVAKFDGYVDQNLIWGAYPGEVVN